MDPVALAGVQNKASARMLSLPVDYEGKRFILRVDPPEYRPVVVNEAHFIARASRFGYSVVSAKLVHDSTGRPGLLVERFDRITGPDGAAVALSVADSAQVMKLHPADKDGVSYEDLTTALARVCAAGVVAARAIFGRCASRG